MIKAVVFDLDNTIYDYDKCDRYAMDKLRRYCMDTFSMKEADFDTLYGKVKEIVKERLGMVGASHNRMLYAQNFMELLKEKPVSHALEFYDTYWNAMLTYMKPYEYVLPLFERLARSGIQIAVLTDLTVHIQHRKIRKLGIADYVDVLVTSEEAGKEKLDEAMFGLVMDKLQLLPEQVIMLGDSLEKDIKGAKTAGMHSILITRMNRDLIMQECIRLIEDENAG